jgi:hypothetical protein
MIEPFWDALRRLSTSEENSPPDTVEEPSHRKNSEDSFLAALPVVRKIVRRRVVALGQAEASDLEQGIILRLLNWREKNHEKSAEMSEGDWESFAARAAYNETNRHFSKSAKADAANLPLEAASEIESPQSLVGDSKTEFRSLVRFVWQETCRLSLRRRRSLLLRSRKLVVYFLTGGITDEELAQSLELATDEWLEIKIKLPLPDAETARFIGESSGENRNLESAIKSTKKARHEARARLRKLTNK